MNVLGRTGRGLARPACAPGAVRGYIRAADSGRPASGSGTDLAERTGRPHRTPTRPSTTAVEVPSIVQIDGVERAASDRLRTLVLAGANTARPLLIQTVHDEEGDRMKIVILGSAADTTELHRTLEAAVEGDSGLILRDGDDA